MWKSCWRSHAAERASLCHALFRVHDFGTEQVALLMTFSPKMTTGDLEMLQLQKGYNDLFILLKLAINDTVHPALNVLT